MSGDPLHLSSLSCKQKHPPSSITLRLVSSKQNIQTHALTKHQLSCYVYCIIKFCVVCLFAFLFPNLSQAFKVDPSNLWKQLATHKHTDLIWRLAFRCGTWGLIPSVSRMICGSLFGAVHSDLREFAELFLTLYNHEMFFWEPSGLPTLRSLESVIPFCHPALKVHKCLYVTVYSKGVWRILFLSVT